ncbi:mechanosensitive ion channel family protein, partial [Burkholderia ubonensis]|uniref:mechanosensitive ion channel family protein n=1 Tax=Burkholderia ubonensis TaxID=101571 RepID=UPI0039F5D6CE
MLNLESAQQFLMTRGLDFGLNLLAAIVLWFVGRWAIRITTRLLGKVVQRSGKVDPTLSDYMTSVVGVLLTILLIL